VLEVNYLRPPITEAVIGIDFSTRLASALVGKVNSRFAKLYPQHQELQNVSVTFSVNVSTSMTGQAETKKKGHRRSSADMAELLVIWPSAFAVSQLAPYPGWDKFFARFKRDWKVWKSVVGFIEISRIGVRFINRVDIPLVNNSAEYEKYLNIYPKLPVSLPNLNSYAIQSVSSLEDIGCSLTINSGVVPSPVLGKASFLLDFDIASGLNVPQNDSEVFKFLGRVRERKNEVFEASVSSSAKALFMSPDKV
jgi:uncharacterized protein (TIGR04255 family)